MEMALTEDKKLIARSPKMEDDLDFEKVKETTKKARQEMIVSEKPMTQAERNSIPLYMNDIARYIQKYAQQGKFQFDYDCTKLTQACFFELAIQFKQKYKEFFVVTSSKTQILTINWSGKSEA